MPSSGGHQAHTCCIDIHISHKIQLKEFHCTGNSTFWLGWLVSELPESVSALYPPSMPGFLCGYWGLNSGPMLSEGTLLPIKASPWHSLFFFLILLFFTRFFFLLCNQVSRRNSSPQWSMILLDTCDTWWGDPALVGLCAFLSGGLSFSSVYRGDGMFT